jgi:polyphosphate kinase
MGPANNDVVRLAYREKVPVAAMKQIMRDTMAEKLADMKYDGEACVEVAKTLSDTIRNRLKELPYQRYKYVCQVAIGERREQGVKMGTRCFWDSNTDNQASETFMNDQIYCVVTSFAVYLY